MQYSVSSVGGFFVAILVVILVGVVEFLVAILGLVFGGG